jgi:chloramphenicol 3-O phosphotransferase
LACYSALRNGDYVVDKHEKPPSLESERRELGASLVNWNALAVNARIVILNGVGSVGKSSVAKALQTITTQPFLHIAMDAFIDMLPEGMIGHPDGLNFETAQDQGQPTVTIKSGAVMQRTMRGMRHAIAAMAHEGNDLIVDDVMLGGGAARQYRELLVHHKVYFVGLFAPLDVLEARERQRGDRLIGLARWQFQRVHSGMTYDLELDTSVASPLECAHKIKLAFKI